MRDFLLRLKTREGFVRFLLVLLVVLLAVTVATSAARQIIDRMGSELKHGHTWDSPIYWAVGRGILNGLTPYVDLFETKPPGVFWLSALSLKLTGGVYALNVLSFICLAVTGVIPLLAAWRILCTRKNTVAPRTRRLVLVCSGLFGLLLMLYSQERSGYGQVEAMGAMFTGLYLLALLFIDEEKPRPRLLAVLLAGLCLACAGLLKEPFVLVGAAASLLAVKTFRDFLYKTVLPLAIGGAVGVGAMAATGVLKPYLTVYLKYMLSSRVGAEDSPFTRMRHFRLVTTDLGYFSGVLLSAILLLVVAVLLFRLLQAAELPGAKLRSWGGWLFRTAAPIVCLLAASFAVALGGQYYNHHFIFALPAYFAFFFCVLSAAVKPPETAPETAPGLPQSRPRLTAGEIEVLLVVLVVFLAAGFCLLPDFTYDEQMDTGLVTMQSNAEYVDALLDETGVERYQFIGFNGYCFYGLTRHSPLGPIFMQDPENFTDENNWFCQSFLRQLDEAEIIIVANVELGVLTQTFYETLQENFRPYNAFYVNEEGVLCSGLPGDFYFQIYLRNDVLIPDNV